MALKQAVRYIELAIKAETLPLLASFLVFLKIAFGQLCSANGASLFAMVLFFMFLDFINII